jgi:site-specific recombinase XerD
VSAGVALAEIRDLLGHASITMTERYAHLAPENIRAAVEMLDSVSRSSHAPKIDRKRKTV